MSIDRIEEVNKDIDHIEHVEKFNPYHGKDGRFASANNHASFTYSPGKSKAHDMAIAREKERTAAAGNEKERKTGLDLHNALFESHTKIYNNLSSDEQKAIKRYMSSTGIKDNYAKKGLLDDALNKAELNTNAILTRGVSDMPTTMAEAKKMIGHKIGTTVEGKPISTSVKTTQNWGTSTLSIKADKGTKGMYVEVARQSKKAQQAQAKAAKNGTVSGEAEFLMPSTTQLRVTGVRMGSFNGKDKIIYDTEIIGQ